MRCIVLSGATVPFEGLVAAVDAELVDVLRRLGYTEVEVQYGHAAAAFQPLPGVQGFDFDVGLRERVARCDLVITHAGAGSILDAVERGDGAAARKVLVVVNTALMDNHQLELARKLDAQGIVVLVARPEDLLRAVKMSATHHFARLPAPVSLQAVVSEELAQARVTV